MTRLKTMISLILIVNFKDNMIIKRLICLIKCGNFKCKEWLITAKNLNVLYEGYYLTM